MYNLTDRQKELLEKLIKKSEQENKEEFVIQFLEFENMYSTKKEYTDDIEILEGKSFFTMRSLNYSGSKYMFCLKRNAIDKYIKYLSSPEHTMFLVLKDISNLLDSKKRGSISLQDISVLNLDMKGKSIIVGEAIKRGYLEGKEFGSTTSSYTDYLIIGVTFNGQSILADESKLFSLNNNFNINNSFDSHNQVIHSQGDSNNITVISKSDNNSVNHTSAELPPKETLAKRILNWLKKVWSGIILGIITGVISTILAQYIINLFK